jgi:formate hydrogenlyase subunit 4
LFLGVIAKTKAKMAGRVGAPLLQPYFDLARLLGKGSVISTTTTWVFFAGPVAGLASTLVASLLVPLGTHPAPIAFAGDLVLFAYLLGLGRFFTICAALDTGSAFEGMGGAREAAFSSLTEPALFMGFVVFARSSASLSLSTMLGGGALGWGGPARASVVLVLISLFIVLLAENCRIPFDDPNTHLELTMIHEVMVLDHSGPALAMILYGACLKLFLFMAIIVRVALPTIAGRTLGWATCLLGMGCLSCLVGIVESVVPRVRLTQAPRLLVVACLLAAFGIILLAR